MTAATFRAPPRQPRSEEGGSVVAGEFGRQGAQPGELAGRQALQAEPEEIVGFLGVVDEVLELV